MKRLSSSAILCMMALAVPAFFQAQTIARLNHEAALDIAPATSQTRPQAPASSQYHAATLPESTLSRLAARALFVESNLEHARLLTRRALQRNPHDAEALFVSMEVAGMQADDAAMLDAAVRLCELGESGRQDSRVRLAAARLRESAANTPDFRGVTPRLQLLVQSTQLSWPELNAALLKAAMDGVPGLNPYSVSRAAGILTDWRMVGPLGQHPPLDFDQDLIPPGDSLTQASYRNRPVENFQFPDGVISLPDYMSHRGVFYAASQFASLTAGNWTISAESAGRLEVLVDGRTVLRASTDTRSSASFDAPAGPHRVLLEFVGSAAPLRIAISRSTPPAARPLQAKASPQEMAYQMAAEHYSAAEFGLAIEQIDALPAARESAALLFLRGQSLEHISPTLSDYATVWHELRQLAPSALSADVALSEQAFADSNWREAQRFAGRVLATRPSNVKALETITQAFAASPNRDPIATNEADAWERRTAVHPSCEGLKAAIGFYRSRNLVTEAEMARQELEGCAPESLDYARSLAERGSHAEAAQSLQLLLAAAPLNRGARLMLIRELQLAGDDEGAQRAAADWLRVAPTAENYHRLAAGEAGVPSAPDETVLTATQFYAPYQRDAIPIALGSTENAGPGTAVVLLNDHVAIARPDGSVSLYVHFAARTFNGAEAAQLGDAAPPLGAQILQLRVLHPDGTETAIEPERREQISALSLSAGDILDQEYVVHFAGDGGIQEHSEAFQFVFGSFNQQVLSARFVALTPAEHADRGVVIATGEAPRMTTHLSDGMLARMWQKDAALRTGGEEPGPASDGLAVVRVVDEENGWSVPSNAEHQRRIDTIHRGPHLEDSSQRAKHNLDCERRASRL